MNKYDINEYTPLIAPTRDIINRLPYHSVISIPYIAHIIEIEYQDLYLFISDNAKKSGHAPKKYLTRMLKYLVNITDNFNTEMFYLDKVCGHGLIKIDYNEGEEDYNVVFSFNNKSITMEVLLTRDLDAIITIIESLYPNQIKLDKDHCDSKYNNGEDNIFNLCILQATRNRGTKGKKSFLKQIGITEQLKILDIYLKDCAYHSELLEPNFIKPPKAVRAYITLIIKDWYAQRANDKKNHDNEYEWWKTMLARIGHCKIQIIKKEFKKGNTYLGREFWNSQ